MPEINNPEIVRFTNEVIRPLAEELRAIVVKLDAAQDAVDRLLPMIPNDTSIINDGRASEGVSQLVGAEIHAMAAIRDQILVLSNQPGVRALISKTSVRPLIIT